MYCFVNVEIFELLFVSAEFVACAAVVKGVAVLVVTAEGQVCGEEATGYGHDDADEDCVPRHVEHVAYIFLGEVGHQYVVNVEENVAARIGEDDGYEEGHNSHGKTALEVDHLDFLCYCTNGLKDIEFLFTLGVVQGLGEEPDQRGDEEDENGDADVKLVVMLVVSNSGQKGIFLVSDFDITVVMAPFLNFAVQGLDFFDRSVFVNINVEGSRLRCLAGHGLVVVEVEVNGSGTGGNVVQNGAYSEFIVIITEEFNLILQQSTAGNVGVNSLDLTGLLGEVDLITYIELVSRYIGDRVAYNYGTGLENGGQITGVAVVFQNLDLFFGDCGVDYLGIHTPVFILGVEIAAGIGNQILECAYILLFHDHVGREFVAFRGVIVDFNRTDIVQCIQFFGHDFVIFEAGFGQVNFKLRTGIIQVGGVDIRHVKTHDEQCTEYDCRGEKLDIVLAETPHGVEFVLDGEVFREDVEGALGRSNQVGVVLGHDEGHGVLHGHYLHGSPAGSQNYEEGEEEYSENGERVEDEAEAVAEIQAEGNQRGDEHGGNKGYNKDNEQFPEARGEEHLEVCAECQINTILEFILVDSDVIKLCQQEDTYSHQNQSDEDEGNGIRAFVVFKREKLCGTFGERGTFRAETRQVFLILRLELLHGIVNIVDEEQINVVTFFAGEVVGVLISIYNLEYRV